MAVGSSGGDLERIVEFTPAYDKRHPDPKKDYGVHGVDLRMVLKGPLGATQFVLSTGWLLPDTVGAHADPRGLGLFSHSYRNGLHVRGTNNLYPMPVDLGYHSPVPQYEGHTPMEGECEYVGGSCYYDGSGLNADEPFRALLEEGSEGVWRVLTEYYDSLFLRASRVAGAQSKPEGGAR